ncbi:MAG: patatin-like phospholipase RssA [Mariprofundaceae bacterium]
MSRKHKIGLALGSGSARGWSHIGVIQALASRGIRPDIVCGSSMGALVGASLACGRLEELEQWAWKLKIRDVLRLLDFTLRGGGLIQGERLAESFCQYVDDVKISELSLDYGAVATDLDAGREFWFQDGSLLDAVRASIALPGLFSPVFQQGKWLVDGGLVNPVPVSMCRAMGAEVVIAVNLNGELAGRRARFAGRETRLALNMPESELLRKITDGLAPLKETIQAILPENGEEKRTPGMFEAMTGAIDIMQDRITKSRLAGDPPEILISPHLGHMGLMEFDRAEEAIEEGVAAVEHAEAAGAFRPFNL